MLQERLHRFGNRELGLINGFFLRESAGGDQDQQERGNQKSRRHRGGSTFGRLGDSERFSN